MLFPQNMAEKSLRRYAQDELNVFWGIIPSSVEIIAVDVVTISGLHESFSTKLA